LVRLPHGSSPCSLRAAWPWGIRPEYRCPAPFTRPGFRGAAANGAKAGPNPRERLPTPGAGRLADHRKTAP
jgi:hypothetical protein